MFRSLIELSSRSVDGLLPFALSAAAGFVSDYFSKYRVKIYSDPGISAVLDLTLLKSGM